MDPVTGAAIITAGSNIANSAFGASQADQAANQQVRVYKNRYQWMMKDMKKAGLNPILAGNLGSGSIPSAPPCDRDWETRTC